MESRVPLPTDNIYKFYALFGLLLVIFSVGGVLYVGKTTNNLVSEVGVEYTLLKADPARSPKQEARFQLLDRQIEVATSERRFFKVCLTILLSLGVLMLTFGFWKWHTQIQPIQDEIAQLTLTKLRKETGQENEA